MIGDLGARHVQGPTSQAFAPLLCILYMFCTQDSHQIHHNSEYLYIYTISYNISCIYTYILYISEIHMKWMSLLLWSPTSSNTSGSDGRAAAESTRTAVHSVGSVVGTQLTSVIPRDFQRHQLIIGWEVPWSFQGVQVYSYTIYIIYHIYI